MTRSSLDVLRDRLTDRDIALLRDVDRFRLLTTRQIQRLHFDHAHPTPLASARSCNRTLARLRDLSVLRALQRRIGGARSGSAGFVWYIGPAGDRVLQALSAGAPKGRRNYREPSRHFTEHTLAVADLAIQAIEAGRRGEFEVLDLRTEPGSWQQSLSRFGITQTLKPDLLLVTASGEYEHHWFVEADLDSEHLPVIMRQCAAYESFRATGRYQAQNGLFPAVLWVTPAPARAAAIRAAVAATAALDPALFRACAAGEYLAVVTGRAPEGG
jgi:Replication-relaxation